MSKPNPSITANLLTRLLDQRTELHATGAEGAGRKTPSEMGSKPLDHGPSTLGPTRKAPGPGHMRSSPRGK